MNSDRNKINKNTSTPKRRRLGTGRILLSQNRVSREENTGILRDVSPITFKKPHSVDKSPERCESPHLPCNQVEYLCESDNSSGGVSFLDNPVTGDWESLVVSTNNLKELGELEESRSNHNAVCETDNISDDMFHSKLELDNSLRGIERITNHVQSTSAPIIDKVFEEDIEQSFDIINESICNLDTNGNESNKSLFETKDSFLLDIKESGIVIEEAKINTNVKIVKDHDSFYGLPKVTRGLFKTYRNIEKFYDWQEECLNLAAIKERRNLIYALPTSGGKTLVAEILMLREVLNRKRNALFILPFVAIVQEKIWALSPFALQLEFLVEEYAAGKGHIPPKKRRKKNSIYIATIEKGLALIRSLIELNRLDELGLIVVDELHLIGEKGRGGTLETLLSTVIFTNKNIQIVGMSATIGNLPDIAQFLKAEVYQRDFRPVELTEYVKLGAMLYKIVWGDSMEVVPERKLAYDYSAAGSSLDPDQLGGLVGEVVPGASCLVFCPTKRNCENVALLLCKLQRREMLSHRTSERSSLAAALRGEGSGGALLACVRCGLGWHHAGLAADERAMLEQGFRSGVISVLCCTSTLAAGVNLPARRVVIRAPRVGRDLLTLGGYRQMAGRAGRAGVCEQGESILLCPEHEWPSVRGVLSGGLPPARSVLGEARALGALLLAAVGLSLATTRGTLRHLMGHTLLAVDCQYSPAVDIKSQCDNALKALLKSGALEVVNKESSKDETCLASDDGNFYVYNHSELVVSRLGKAAIKGCLDLSVARQLLQDLEVASRSLVLMGSLHLIYLVTPHDAAGIKPDYRHYYSLYSELDEEGLQTAKILGITEMTAIKMMTGKPITNVSERVLCRFYLALMLHDLWKQVPFPAVAEKYSIPRGTVQMVMSSAAALASSGQRFCEELEQLWTFRALFAELAPRLQHCAAPELIHLMDLPAVKKARAVQLMRAGYKRIEDLAKASVDDLMASVAHLSKTAASHLVSAARLMLIEKVENLRAEAEDVMEDLKKS